jgi:hypothetical protein
MRTFKLVSGLALVIVLAASTAALAAPRMGMGGWGMGTKYGRMYNPQTVETISGEVVKVEKIKPLRGMSYGIHIVVKTAAGDMDVHLGPAWYIDNQEIAIKAGDKVEVKGSKVDISGKPAIIAAEVTKGDESMVLRDGAGVPVWSGWRRR